MRAPSRSSLTGTTPTPVSRLNLVQLERPSEDEGRAERRMPGERDLDNRREDAHACMPVARGRVHEHRLGEVHLPRQRLQQLLGELARVGEDRELVALERPVGEDVADDVAVATHPRNLLSGYGCGCSYDGMIEIDTEAALLNGIGSKPLDILKNERVPGRSLKFPPPVPPPSHVALRVEDHARHGRARQRQRRMDVDQIPSTEPSQAGSKRSGTRWTLSSAGWKFFADRAASGSDHDLEPLDRGSALEADLAAEEVDRSGVDDRHLAAGGPDQVVVGQQRS